MHALEGISLQGNCDFISVYGIDRLQCHFHINMIKSSREGETGDKLCSLYQSIIIAQTVYHRHELSSYKNKHYLSSVVAQIFTAASSRVFSSVC